MIWGGGCSSSYDDGGQGGSQFRLHTALGGFITLLVTLLAMKYQPVSVSPFEANPIDMMFFMGFLSLYISGLMAAVMMRGTSRGLPAVALLLWHLSLISGFFASASLLYLLVPTSFWWVSIASLSLLLLLIAPPCKPIELFYSKSQQHYYYLSRRAQAFHRSEEAADLENNNLQPLPDSHGSNEEGGDHPPDHDSSVQGGNSCTNT